MLVVVGYSLLDVDSEGIVEACTSALVEDSAELVKILLSSIPLDEEDTTAVDTSSVGTDCEEPTTTTVLTAELTVCDVPNGIEKSEAELFDCDRTGMAGELSVELIGPEEELAVRLVGMGELNTAEPSIVDVNCGTEILLVSIVVTALELDTVA